MQKSFKNNGAIMKPLMFLTYADPASTARTLAQITAVTNRPAIGLTHLPSPTTDRFFLSFSFNYPMR
jgi:hypothetical protein